MKTSRLESCGLLWSFYQLFGRLFWRHPFTAEDPLVSKWCNAKLANFWVNYAFKAEIKAMLYWSLNKGVSVVVSQIVWRVVDTPFTETRVLIGISLWPVISATVSEQLMNQFQLSPRHTSAQHTAEQMKHWTALLWSMHLSIDFNRHTTSPMQRLKVSSRRFLSAEVSNSIRWWITWPLLSLHRVTVHVHKVHNVVLCPSTACCISNNLCHS